METCYLCGKEHPENEMLKDTDGDAVCTSCMDDLTADFLWAATLHTTFERFAKNAKDQGT